MTSDADTRSAAGRRDTVVVGASAGGVEALRTLVAGLPEDFPAALLVVLHVPQDSPNALAAILDRSGPLPVGTARDGDRLRRGRVLVAPGGYHLLVRDGEVRLSRGPTENGHRPSVDALFRSAALARGPLAVAVVLSGTLDDGTSGLAAVRSAGGVAVVQDPDDAVYPGMPRSALAAVGADHVVPVAGMPALLDRLVREPRPDTEDPRDRPDRIDDPDHPDHHPHLVALEDAMADLDPDALSGPLRPGTPAPYSCPDCNGTLFRLEPEGADLLRFRCRVGHAWTAGSLAAEQAGSHETALWTALRSLEERSALHHELATRAAARGHAVSAAQFRGTAEEAGRAATAIRTLVARGTDPTGDPTGDHEGDGAGGPAHAAAG
ncbi:chemotaxis protein CheB [Aquipuribacter nitratireducens]|uniref:protein-glutamate methylesterase n=1 Tax=Aquipuribacter nitratireducens TaxID=650104 RepID=A0ABW0GM60_9MICO